MQPVITRSSRSFIIRAMREVDIKKIIAMSTLSQLGLIFITLGTGNFIKKASIPANLMPSLN